MQESGETLSPEARRRRAEALIQVKSLIAAGLAVRNFEGLKIAEAERLLKELGVEIT